MENMEVYKIEDVTGIDYWQKQPVKIKEIPKSQWRQRQIGDDFNQQPGTHELKRIYYYLNNKYADYDIMKTFGISAEVLVAIKQGMYDPVEGIIYGKPGIQRDLKEIEKSLGIEKLKIKAQSGKRKNGNKGGVKLGNSYSLPKVNFY